MTPIAIKDLGDSNEWGLPAKIKIWGLNIDSKKETVTVFYEIVTTTPSGVEDSRVSGSYTRFNSRVGDQVTPTTKVTRDNLKFDILKASQIGQGIIALLQNDLQSFDGNPESLRQNIYTDPITEP